MNKYKLNFLRWITRGKISDEVLKSAHHFKMENDNFCFRVRMNLDTKSWIKVSGRLIEDNVL